jgi:hypothetical protein
MDPLELLPLVPSSLLTEALALVGAAVMLLVFATLGVLLPGLLTALGGATPERRDVHPELGPVAYPVISEPAPRDPTPTEAKQDQGRRAARPLLWRHLSANSP